jgi:hypothetical protein
MRSGVVVREDDAARDEDFSARGFAAAREVSFATRFATAGFFDFCGLEGLRFATR